jgi:hypothetical protein
MIADRAAEEEARIAKTLQTHFSGSRVEQRMKMQEKQEVARNTHYQTADIFDFALFCSTRNC